MRTSSANVAIVDLSDGRRVCLSYGVPVAAFVPGIGYVKTDRRYSVTTSRHANQFIGQHTSTVATDDQFRTLIAPVTDTLIGGVRKNARVR